MQKTSSPAADLAVSIESGVLEASSFQEVSFQAATFRAALSLTINFVITTFEAEIARKQLYYHSLGHIYAVARRAGLVFDTVVPFLPQPVDGLSLGTSLETDWERQRGLLYLSALAHDMVQIFVSDAEPHTPRQRKTGLSERVTFERLSGFMQQLRLPGEAPSSSSSSTFLGSDSLAASRAERSLSPFTCADIALVREAIAATVCQIDLVDGGIYQPLLYSQLDSPFEPSSKPAFGCEPSPSLSLVARCLALADIGTLGMEGLSAYREEGSLLLLEENLDVVAFVKDSLTLDEAVQERLRQRLLKRARFQVTFARSRLARLETELQGLPEGAIAPLKQKVFKYLTPETIEQLEELTPTAEDTSLTTLLDFFQLSTHL